MSHDLNSYASQTIFRLVLGAIILLFVVGGGLIYLFYGLPAAITGVLCLAGAMVPVGLITFALWGMDWIVKRAREKEEKE